MTHDGELGEQEKTIQKELRRNGHSETVIDHWLSPRNFRRINGKECDGYSGWFTGPCGDSMEICLRVKDAIILDAAFVSDICIGAVAAGSMVTEMAKGKTIRGAFGIAQDDILKELGGLPENFVHCASLAVDTLKAAIRDHIAHKTAPWRRLFEQKHYLASSVIKLPHTEVKK